MPDTNWTKFWKDAFATQRQHPRKDAQGKELPRDSLDNWGHIGDFIRWANQPVGGAAPQPNGTGASAPDPGLSFNVPQANTMNPAAAVSPARPQGGTSFDDFARAVIAQESGGRYGLMSSAGAQGVGQVMPATAQALAARNGIPWNPALMTGTTTEAKDYQDNIARLALEDAWQQGQQDPAKAAQYYHAGPNPAQAGPKTAAYVDSVLGRMGLGTATAAPGSPFVSRGTNFVDPAVAMSLIPNPQQVAHVNLPDAPVLAADPARPQYQLADKDALLAELKAAMQPVPVDEAARKKATRFGDINGALMGALVGLAGGPLGVLLGAGIGGLKAHTDTRLGQMTNDRLRSEKAREAAIALATQGFGIDMGNLAMGNKNLDQQWLTGKNVVDTSNTNAVNANQRMTEEILKNAGIDQFNVVTKNDANRTRAQVGTAALEGAASAQNQANREQTQLDAAALAYGSGGKELQTRANSILAGVGIPAERLDGAKPDATLDNARNTAYAVAAGNVEGAIGGLANEIVSTGLYKDVLGQADAKEVEKALRNKQLEQAAAIVAAALNADRSATAKLSDQLAARGLTTAKIISGNRKRDQTQGQQQPATAAR